jgi:hypothetical protein
LFPLGVTGPANSLRPRKVTFQEYLRHLLRWYDHRFAVHEHFIFPMYNLLQRNNVSESTKHQMTGKNKYIITVNDIKEALDQLSNHNQITNPNVASLFSKVQTCGQRNGFLILLNANGLLATKYMDCCGSMVGQLGL